MFKMKQTQKKLLSPRWLAYRINKNTKKKLNSTDLKSKETSHIIQQTKSIEIPIKHD